MNLWKHQEQAILKARSLPNLALFYSMGTGKTATIVNILREEYNKEKRIVPTLIISPLSVCQQWKNEFARWSKVPQEKILVLTGKGKDRVAAMQALKSGAIIITNYESLVKIPAFYDELAKYQPEIVVLDESHRVKDASCGTAKKVYFLTDRAARRFLLTGTPILNSMLDLFGQFRALNPDIFGKNFFVFKNRYFYDKNAYMPKHIHFPDWQPRPDADKMLARAIAGISLQAKKEDCLDLPPLLNVTIPVELSKEQAKAYEQMRKEFVAELGGKVVTAEFAMTKTLRMRQILSGFIQPNEGEEAVWFDELPRLRALKELLEGLNGEKTIIWTNFATSYQKIVKLCESMGLKPVLFTGEQSYAEKEKSKEAFTKGDAQVFIANPAAGGTGVDGLQISRVAIYYSLGYSLGEYLQSAARNHRGGSERHNKVTHYFLTATGTLDEVVVDALRNKKEVGEAVLNWARKSLDD